MIRQPHRSPSSVGGYDAAGFAGTAWPGYDGPADRSGQRKTGVAEETMTDGGAPVLVCIIDDDAEVRSAMESLLRSAGYRVLAFADAEEFLACGEAADAACLMLDVYLDGTDGLEVQQALHDRSVAVPVVLMTGQGDVQMTVRGMKAGAVDFLTKPFAEEEVLLAVAEAVERDRRHRVERRQDDTARALYAKLTPRERDVMALVTAGLMNKQVAGKLELSEVTVKIHRGNLMRKMNAQSLADLVRMAEILGVREQTVTRYGAAG
ncbi:response regulator transcription factor [Azospirillum picis]|uniref:FixJ family two-component response regulator n=1 Tax=Azospirillum picis TaxID=488438 RepID=A0ABU0MSX0_9PROT|nr:response regulator [Azospirillum picis]MBP2302622.1 FixJ family two-component response regulator [Azospirillum picis]MDQ0536283.1 FixJ family two-component response regulator [Azospirillum picis]